MDTIRNNLPLAGVILLMSLSDFMKTKRQLSGVALISVGIWFLIKGDLIPPEPASDLSEFRVIVGYAFIVVAHAIRFGFAAYFIAVGVSRHMEAFALRVYDEVIVGPDRDDHGRDNDVCTKTTSNSIEIYEGYDQCRAKFNSDGVELYDEYGRCRAKFSYSGVELYDEYGQSRALYPRTRDEI